MATVNSGMIVRVFPITRIQCSGLAATQNIFIPMAQHIDATTFTEADLLVRFHTGTNIAGNSGANAFVAVGPEGYDFDDPASIFLPPSPSTAGSPNAVAIGTTTSYPFYGVTQIQPPFGRFLMVGVVANMGTATGTLTLVVSADLVLKGGDASGLPMAPNAFRGYRVM